ncbi:hypothetical protein SCYAM73S_00971 [Streptomyces cyaneofuscatus]
MHLRRRPPVRNHQPLDAQERDGRLLQTQDLIRNTLPPHGGPDQGWRPSGLIFWISTDQCGGRCDNRPDRLSVPGRRGAGRLPPPGGRGQCAKCAADHGGLGLHQPVRSAATRRTALHPGPAPRRGPASTPGFLLHERRSVGQRPSRPSADLCRGLRRGADRRCDSGTAHSSRLGRHSRRSGNRSHLAPRRQRLSRPALRRPGVCGPTSSSAGAFSRSRRFCTTYSAAAFPTAWSPTSAARSTNTFSPRAELGGHRLRGDRATHGRPEAREWRGWGRCSSTPPVQAQS